MDRIIFKSLFGYPISSAAIIIGGVQAVIYAGLFLRNYAEIMVSFMDGHFSTTVLLEELTLQEMTNGATLVCCILNAVLVVGVLKSKPGFILSWLVNQLVWIWSSFLTVLYFLAATYLTLPPMQALFELLLNAIQGFTFLVVLSHYIQLRSGNLVEEE